MIIPLLEILNNSKDLSFFKFGDGKRIFTGKRKRIIRKNINNNYNYIYSKELNFIFLFIFWRNKFIWNVYKFISLNVLKNFLKKI